MTDILIFVNTNQLLTSPHRRDCRQMDSTYLAVVVYFLAVLLLTTGCVLTTNLCRRRRYRRLSADPEQPLSSEWSRHEDAGAPSHASVPSFCAQQRFDPVVSRDTTDSQQYQRHDAGQLDPPIEKVHLASRSPSDVPFERMSAIYDDTTYSMLRQRPERHRLQLDMLPWLMLFCCSS